MCHMTPEIPDFVPGSLVETDKYNKYSDGHYVTADQTGEYQINMSDDNGKPFITTLYKLLLYPECFCK